MRTCKWKGSAQKSLGLAEFFNDISVFHLLWHASLPPPKIADTVLQNVGLVENQEPAKFGGGLPIFFASMIFSF